MNQAVLDAPTDADDVLSAVTESMREGVDDTAALQAQISELQTLLTRERTQMRQNQRDAVIREAASMMRAANAADVIAWAERNAPDALAAVVDENGIAQPDAARSLVEACRVARPHYFRSSAPGVPSNAGAVSAPTDRETLDRALNGRRLFSL